KRAAGDAADRAALLASGAAADGGDGLVTRVAKTAGVSDSRVAVIFDRGDAAADRRSRDGAGADGNRAGADSESGVSEVCRTVDPDLHFVQFVSGRGTARFAAARDGSEAISGNH